MIDFDLEELFDETHFGVDLSIKKVNTDLSKHQRFINFYDSECYKFKDYYYALLKSGDVLMTTDVFEVLTNQFFFNNVSGDVLIFGLGLGWIIFPLLSDDRVKSIKVVEIDTDIISFIGDKVKKMDINNKVTIVNGDLYDWYRCDSSKYDFIYFDIYNTPQESIQDKEKVDPLYKNLLKDNGVSYFWCWDIKDLIV